MRTSRQPIDLDLAMPRQKAAFGLLATVVATVVSGVRILKNRRAVNRLADLDDAHLADIGLTRTDVSGILRTTALHEDPTFRLARTARARAQKALRIERP